MKILGLGGSQHDFCSCLLKDGKIIRAIAEERLSGEKNAIGIRSRVFNSINYCLEPGLNVSDLDLIVDNNLMEKFSLANANKKYLQHIISINHHMAHLSASYYTSGFKKAACLVLDGYGSGYNENKYVEIHTEAIADSGDIERVQTVYSNMSQYTTASLGHFYLYFTYQCDFLYGEEGKLMGLASYGTAKYVDVIKSCMEPEKHIYLNIDVKNKVKEIIDKDGNSFQTKADLAHAAQIILEDNVFDILNQLYQKTKCDNLCFSGGIALNSALNGKIKKQTSFKNVYVFPASGDNGTAIGAALYGYYNILKQPYLGRERQTNVYFGKSYNDKDILDTLGKYKDKVNYIKYPFDQMLDIVSRAIACGEIIGWHQDGCETGPRALGNRSILADPRNAEMKDILNNKVKFREDFRPFAPVVMFEYVHDYFETDFTDNPFMLYIGKVKENKIEIIPAVTHVDKTARFQTVSKKNNFKLYSLLEKFYKLTGVPVLINTSLNIKGRPIAETPKDTLYCLLNSQIDKIIIGDYLIRKK